MTRVAGWTGTVALLVGVLAVAGGVACVASLPSSGGSAPTPEAVAAGPTGPPRIGSPAPAFVATDVDGRTVDLRELAGHPVWLTVGASWCQSCRAENPDIEAAFERHRAAGLVLVAVFVSEDSTGVDDYATRVGLTYRLIPDPESRLARVYRVLGLPSHFFIDRGGVLRSIRIGSLTPSGMDEALRGIGG